MGRTKQLSELDRRFMDVAKEDVQKVGVTEEDRDRNRWTQMITP